MSLSLSLSLPLPLSLNSVEMFFIHMTNYTCYCQSIQRKSRTWLKGKEKKKKGRENRIHVVILHK